MALSDFNNSNLGNLIALNNSVDELVQEDVAYSDLNKLVDQQVEKDIVGEKLANDVNLQQAGRNKYLLLKDKQKVISAAVDNEIAGLRNITGSESNDILYGGPILNDQQLQPGPLDDELSVQSANQKDFINPPYVKDGSILPIEFGPAAEDSARREGFLKRNNVSAPMNNVNVVPPINAAPINVGVVPPPVAANTDSSDSSAGFNLANTDSSAGFNVANTDSSAGFNVVKTVGDISADSMSTNYILPKAEAEAQSASVTVAPKRADSAGAVPVTTTIQNPLIRNLDKKIQTSLAGLNTKADPESSKPFFDWLGDFSAGLRAAGKSGDQGLGAIATGFEAARAGRKQRIETQVAAEKISIENIKNLGEIREDIITADRLGAPGSSAQALYGAYVGPGEPVLGANGIIPRAYMNRLGYDQRTTGTYSTTKAGRVVQQFHTQDPTKDKKIRFYPINSKDKLPTREGSVLISPSNPKFREYTQNPDFTQIGPSEITEVLTDEQLANYFKGNPAYLKRLQDAGATVRVTKNEDGTTKSVDILNTTQQKLQGYYNQNSGTFQVGDPNNPRHRAKILAGNLVPVTIQMDQIGKSSSVQLRNEINSAAQGIEIINKLKELRARGNGDAILGSIATAKRAGANFLDIVTQAGSEFLPFYTFGQQLEFDINNDLIDSNVVAWLNRDLSEAKVLETSLIYKYAKVLKGTGRLNSDDIRRASDALGKRGFLKSDVDIFARYDAILPFFRTTIEDKTAQLKTVRQAEKSLEFPSAEGTSLGGVSEKAKILSTDLKDNEKFSSNPNANQINRLLNNPTAEEKRQFNDFFGPGTAEIVLKRNK